MISVQNLRPRLNGSSWFAGLAALLFIVGCTPKVRVLRAPDSGAPTKKTERPEEKREATEKAPDAEKVAVNEIALLLPFELDKANPHAPSAADIKRSALALDFYQGFKLGLDVLADQGSHFRLNVLDTRDDTGENVRIAKSDAVQHAALVVGPVFPKEIQVFGFNASLGDALQISPLAASTPAEFNLPNLVTVTPPLSAHIKQLAAHIAAQYRTGDAVILYDTQDATSRQFIQPLKAEIQRIDRNIDIAQVQDDAGMESRVHVSGKNLVVLATTNKYQISPILAHLRGLHDELSYQIQLFGHPNWAKLEFDDADGLGVFRTRITASYFIDRSDPAVRRFDQRYREGFGVAPTEFAYKGYDAAYYFGGLLGKYGEGYKEYIVKEAHQGLHNAMRFEYNPAWGYVNNAISMMQYGSGDFRPID